MGKNTEADDVTMKKIEATEALMEFGINMVNNKEFRNRLLTPLVYDVLDTLGDFEDPDVYTELLNILASKDFKKYTKKSYIRKNINEWIKVIDQEELHRIVIEGLQIAYPQPETEVEEDND